MINTFWDALGEGWFIMWAVDDISSKYPNAIITVFLCGKQICGLLPKVQDGTIINLEVSDKFKEEFRLKYENRV